MSRNDILLALALNITAGLIVIIFFQPAINWTRNALLSVFTLGRDRLKYVFYKSVATGFYSSTNQNLAGIGMLICLIGATSEIMTDDYVRVLSGLNMFPLLFILARESSIHAAIVHYRQMLSMIRPFVSQDQINKYDSRVSQIQTDQDYKSLITEIETLAKANSCHVPTFTPW